MGITRVNSTSITADHFTSGPLSAALPSGTGCKAGDLIVVAVSDNSSATLSVKDSVNGVNFTELLETTENGHGSALFTFYYVTPQDLPDGTDITLTSSQQACAFAADIFRGSNGVIDASAVGNTGSSGSVSSVSGPALGAAPAAGSLVLTFAQDFGPETLTAGSSFTTGSAVSGSQSSQAAAIGYVLSADGSSTYGSTWSLATSGTGAVAQTVAFAAQGPVPKASSDTGAGTEAARASVPGAVVTRVNTAPITNYGLSTTTGEPGRL